MTAVMTEQEQDKAVLAELVAAAESLGADGSRVDHLIRTAFLKATGSAKMDSAAAQALLSSVTEPQALKITEACNNAASEYDADLADRPVQLKALMIAGIAYLDYQTGSSNSHLFNAFHHVYDNAGPPISVTYAPVAQLMDLKHT